MSKTGRLYVFSGPSGAGKDAVVGGVLGQNIQGLLKCITATTRAPRGDEKHGQHYFFYTREEFLDRAANRMFLEHAEYNGHLYGTPRDFVEEKLAIGKDILLIVDVQGAAQIRAQMPDAVFVFILPPSITELERRLRARGTDDDSRIAERLHIAQNEMDQASLFQHKVVNRTVKSAIEQVVRLVTMYRWRDAQKTIEQSQG